MEWTIEKIRELPPNNWLGIKRISEHGWQIGGDIPGSMVIWTGDGGVLEYCRAFETLAKPDICGKGIIDQINQASPTTYSKLTYKKLKRLIAESLFNNTDGVD